MSLVSESIGRIEFLGSETKYYNTCILHITSKNNCLATIGERPLEMTDGDKWNEMDGNAIAYLHLALADGVLFSVAEKKTTKGI